MVLLDEESHNEFHRSAPHQPGPGSGFSEGWEGREREGPGFSDSQRQQHHFITHIMGNQMSQGPSLGTDSGRIKQDLRLHFIPQARQLKSEMSKHESKSSIMRKLLGTLFCLLFVISFSHEAFSQLNWRLTNGTSNVANVENNGRYLLVNQTNNSPLKYGKRSNASRAVGCINIVWGRSNEVLGSKNFVNIIRKPGKTGPIETGELVALRFEGGGFLVHQNKTIGINLGWVGSNTQSIPYIWEIRYAGNKVGETLRTNTEFGIFCHTNSEWLVYCDRNDPGINLGWTDSCSGCSRGGFDWLRDYVPISKKVIGDVISRKPDGEDLRGWCKN